MTPLTLEEFAQEMRRNGDIRQADMADEILALIDIEAEVAEPYAELCGDLEIYAPDSLKDKPAKALEWLGDRSNLLEEIEKVIKDSTILPETGANGKPIKRDADDAVKELLAQLETVRNILDGAGFEGTALTEAMQQLAERAERAPEETEIMTYDL